MRNIDNIIGNFKKVVESHYLGNGKYGKTLERFDARFCQSNEYGCADAANILYTFGCLPVGKEADELVSEIQRFQNSETGLFREPTHHYLHTTAHCIAALNLFDAKPLYPLTQLENDKLFTVDGMYKLLEELDWVNNAWPDSHRGAGIFSIALLTGHADLDYQQAYQKWIFDNTDDEFGIGRKGTTNTNYMLWRHLGGWFHYMFNFEAIHAKWNHPDKLIDTCISIYKKREASFYVKVGYWEIDFIYALNRATRQTSHRFDEAKEVLKSVGNEYIDFLEGIDYKNREDANDLHGLFGATCALAELQQAVPGEFVSTIPLRLVLDRRPFI